MPTLVERAKSDLREFLNKVYRETKYKVPAKDWEDFEELFWKIFPLIQEPYISTYEEQHNGNPIATTNHSSE